MIDPLLKPLPGYSIEMKMSRKLMMMMKRSIRAIYEYYIIIGATKNIVYSVKDQCDVIYNMKGITQYDFFFNEITQQISKRIEYILLNGIDHNFNDIYDTIFEYCNKLSNIFKNPDFKKLQNDYETKSKSMYSLPLKDFII